MPESTTTSTVDDSVAGRSVSGAPIELAHVTKRYAGQQAPAVDDFSMHINAGEIVVFVGPSGCGKTTTMKMINRLIEPSAGRIMLGDQDVTKLEPAQLRRRIGYAIQQVGLFPHMTIAQNIGQVPAMLKWDRQRIRARVDEMLELTGLDPDAYRGRFPRQLSGGQQQRGSGWPGRSPPTPPVLLMDEPFGAVDPITRGNLQDELLNLQSQLGKTIVFVTHDFDEAIKLGDRIAVLGNQSKILQYDTPELRRSWPRRPTTRWPVLWAVARLFASWASSAYTTCSWGRSPPRRWASTRRRHVRRWAAENICCCWTNGTGQWSGSAPGRWPKPPAVSSMETTWSETRSPGGRRWWTLWTRS
ncbi:ABC transporter ATP-binding protein [Fodinicola feengrottensis]|uniref:ABC transporter ATP-binding protein n=1 Tax=Fodinicola feengrottensis TaxID=435914 RepID=UPI0036F1F0A0